MEESKPKSYILALFTIILVQLCLLLWLVRMDSLTMHWIVSSLHPTRERQSLNTLPTPDLNADPAIGYKLPHHSETATLLKSIHAAPEYCLVVYAGDCASCLSVNLSEWQKEAKTRRIPMIVITSAPPAQAEVFCKDFRLTGQLLSLSAPTFFRQINCLWAGRAYLFASSGRLLWLQKEQVPGYTPFADSSFLTHLKENTP
jgi:hypothetical protein